MTILAVGVVGVEVSDVAFAEMGATEDVSLSPVVVVVVVGSVAEGLKKDVGRIPVDV